MSQSNFGWLPKIGGTIWLNHPDSDEPLGEAVAFVPEGRAPRGTATIYRDESGNLKAIHPDFALPFPLYSEEWERARR